jgi:hypothetical protein
MAKVQRSSKAAERDNLEVAVKRIEDVVDGQRRR